EMSALRFVTRNIWDEYALCLLLKRRRMRLPTLALNAWFPEADDVPVWISVLPRGAWTSSVVNIVYLLKLVRLLEPRRALEIASYRGCVARAIAEHMPAQGTLVTVDINPDHGAAYRDTELAGRIDRRVGAIDAGMFDEQEYGIYDLIFVDAGHE